MIDPILIADAIEAGVALFQAAGGKVTPSEQALANSGATIIATAETLFTAIKSDLAGSDLATVEAALQTAHDTADAEITAVLAKIAADAASA